MKKYLIFGFLIIIFFIYGCGIKDGSDEIDDNKLKESNVLAGTVTKYIEFNKKEYDKALQENKVILLNFYASWCPICRSEEKEVISAFNEINKENIIGFRVNYNDLSTDDFEEELAKEFGITYQHTKVILKNGKRELTSLETWNKERYIDEIGKFA